MENNDDLEKEDIIKFIKEADDKIEKFASILEKFGLDIITKMGQTNLKINVLTDKIDVLSNATLDIKSLTPQLTNVIENQKILEEELDLIRSLMQRSDISFHSREANSEKVEQDTSATDKKQAIIDQFNTLESYITKNDDPQSIIESLENIKENIFVFTGGHRILYEIGQFESKLNGLETLPDDVKNSLKEKITFWINKLSVKG
ncbi:MAG: hypothetical protein HWN81_17920 [Candidatus Lokiarchaeota archaeon]|nr:hypothetical protein [Candidatus Lokiarchaeota archaeon]